MADVGRKYFRQGNDYKVSTFRKFPGILQCNIVAIPSRYSHHFDAFCKNNSAPIPLLYRSFPGQKTAGFLCNTSDIRTDLPAYLIHRDDQMEVKENLGGEDWSDIVTYYIGCSYTFDEILVKLNIEFPTGNVGVLKTNIPCIPSGPFQCNMIVSLRCIPIKHLDEVFNITAAVDAAHGAPIHIGNPADIGLEVKNGKMDGVLGYDGVLVDGSVPCFWACGVTGSESLKGAGIAASYSHYPGCMFVTDVSTEHAIKKLSEPYPCAIVIQTSNDRYAPLSVGIWKTLSEIAEKVLSDPGRRGVAHFYLAGDLGKACLDLSARATHVGIIVGFPCFDDYPCEENDGIAGAIYIARALQAIGIKVTFILDHFAHTLADLLTKCFTDKFLHVPPTIIQVSNTEEYIFTGYSHVIAIEKPCIGVDGKYYNMKGVNVTHRMGASSDLFASCQDLPQITTIGIGDGGNELGMGKVYSSVVVHINNGPVIAAAVSCDFLITAGVSNWGGLGLAAGLYLVRSCKVHDRYRRRGRGCPDCSLDLDAMLLTEDMDYQLHVLVNKMGFRDGINGSTKMTVDNLEYATYHKEILVNVRSFLCDE